MCRVNFPDPKSRAAAVSGARPSRQGRVSRRLALVLPVSLVVGLAGCVHHSSLITPIEDAAPPRARDGAVAPDRSDGAAREGGAVADGGADAEAGAPLAADPGWVPLRHLTNTEYDETVHDLLGVDGNARATFEPTMAAESASDDFDVIPAGDDVDDARYEQWSDEADRVATAAFADPTLRARIVTCQPAAPGDTACTRAIVSAFGLRAWRRPLTSDEVDGLAALATAALGEGTTFEDAIQRVVTALLSSAPFLYRMEIDPNPLSLVPRQLTPFELASRLSYLVWSSMPDDELFAAATDGSLLRDDVLRAELDRLIDDPRAEQLVESFGGNWLGAATLTRFAGPWSTWTSIQHAVIQELDLYIAEFLHMDHDFRTFLGADFNFIDATLGELYGMSTTGLLGTPVRVVDTTDQRRGYLGLGAFLIASSAASAPTRTSPTARGQWILSRLLCAPPPPAPAGTDDVSPTDMRTGRLIVDSIQGQATCETCHASMDGLGLALEPFDELGQFRTQYFDATPIDGKGALPDGTPVTGEPALADGVAADPRFLACAAREAMRYALNRELGASDEAPLASLIEAWTQSVPTLRGLLEQIVLDDTFRYRRPEGI